MAKQFLPQKRPLYDVGETLKAIYAKTIKASPPRVSPAQLLPIIKWLEEVTAKESTHFQRLWDYYTNEGDTWAIEALQRVKPKLGQWQLRLVTYRAAIDACINTGRGDDGECTAWTVLAPLFFGIYDGPLGTSAPKASDLREPFMLANELAAIGAFDEESWSDGWRYALEETERVVGRVTEVTIGTVRLMGEAAGAAVAGAAGGLLGGLGDAIVPIGFGLALLWYFTRKKG